MKAETGMKSTQKLVLCAFFVALMTVSAYLKIYVAGVPHSFQFFFAVMAGMLLGGRLGARALAVYVIMGLIGIPVFTGGGGLSYIFQPTFGYLIGFIVTAYVTGIIARRGNSVPSYRRLICAALVGFAITYALGMIYFYLIRNFYMTDAPISVWAVFINCFVLIAPGDTVLCIGAVLIAKRLIPVVNK